MKSIEEYGWKKRGLRRLYWCKPCGKLRDREYYEANKDRIDASRRESTRKYQKSNRERYQEYARTYYNRKKAELSRLREERLILSKIQTASEIMQSHVPVFLPWDVPGYKICPKCGELKELSEYGKGQSRCKVCARAGNKLYRDRNPEKVRAKNIRNKSLVAAHNRRERSSKIAHVRSYLESHQCTICGESNVLVLAFHHTSEDKVDGISRMISRHRSIEEIDLEITKCEVVCHNCHLIIHKIDKDLESLPKVRARNLSYRHRYLIEHPCSSCGENNPDVLQFHHCNGTKIDDISRMVKSSSLERLALEFSKCSVLCANCHRLRHS